MKFRNSRHTHTHTDVLKKYTVHFYTCIYIYKHIYLHTLYTWTFPLRNGFFTEFNAFSLAPKEWWDPCRPLKRSTSSPDRLQSLNDMVEAGALLGHFMSPFFPSDFTTIFCWAPYFFQRGLKEKELDVIVMLFMLKGD